LRVPSQRASLRAGLLKKIDLREHGSGNTGATNTFRVLGWKAGLPVAVIDMFKGFAAVAFLTRIAPFDGPVYPNAVLFIAATLASVLGHIKPVFARFKGDRGFGPMEHNFRSRGGNRGGPPGVPDMPFRLLPGTGPYRLYSVPHLGPGIFVNTFPQYNYNIFLSRQCSTSLFQTSIMKYMLARSTVGNTKYRLRLRLRRSRSLYPSPGIPLYRPGYFIELRSCCHGLFYFHLPADPFRRT